MSRHPDTSPGPLREEKEGQTSEAGKPQPEAAEVESARLLAVHARDQLHTTGFSDDRIRELADRFIAEDRGEETGAFVDWARVQGPR